MPNTTEVSPGSVIQPYPWSDIEPDIIERLLSEGLSSTQVAKRLGDETNQPGRFSKNMIVGKCWRIGLELNSTKQSRARNRSWHPAEPTPNPFPPPGHCIWPIGHPGNAGFHFCGHVTRLGRSYCPEHMLRSRPRRDVPVPT